MRHETTSWVQIHFYYRLRAYSTCSSVHEAAGSLGTGRLVTKHINGCQLKLDDERWMRHGSRTATPPTYLGNLRASQEVCGLWPGLWSGL